MRRGSAPWPSALTAAGWLPAARIPPSGCGTCWQPIRLRRQRVLKGPEDRVAALAISPDGRWLAAASGYVTWLWDLNATDTAPAAQAHALKGHSDFVNSLAFSPDSRWLATGSGDKTVRLWDLHAADPAAQPTELTRSPGWGQHPGFQPRWALVGHRQRLHYLVMGYGRCCF